MKSSWARGLTAWRWVGLLCALFCLVACTDAAPEEEESAATEDALNDLFDWKITRARPEVGVLISNDGVSCTGTLVRADIVLTAAHCFGFRSSGPSGPRTPAYFRRYDLPAGVSAPRREGTLAEMRASFVLLYEERVVGWHIPEGVTDSMWVDNDWALMKLARPVSPSVVPRFPTIATAERFDPGLPTIYGAGHSWYFRPAEGLMRRTPIQLGPFGARLSTMAGDSGGPIFASDGTLIAILRGVSLAGLRGTMLWDKREAIQTEMATLDRLYPTR